ncbi:hypothetical protein SAMN05421543_12925 [Alicyclobacillus macrosporangiidus]|uniref:Uncharacterized protein n=1 Tax=Alicyclobacillus macrosporangiidus TaxID=392015 RepID=A0A1I7L9D6_9BACL|nr:hypothetical protein SAMN05421543_12925 [Alicyclobacillus macrosporangiidus]
MVFLEKTFLIVPPAPAIVADVMGRLNIPKPSKMIDVTKEKRVAKKNASSPEGTPSPENENSEDN